MKWFLLALVLVVAVVTTGALIQERCSSLSPATINALFEKDMRGEIHLDQETIDVLNILWKGGE